MIRHKNKLKDKIRVDAFGALSRATGIPSKEIARIAKSVTRNKKLLNSCSFHIFNQIDDPQLSRVFVCENCGGTVDALRKNWYERGIEHSQNREKK